MKLGPLSTKGNLCALFLIIKYVFTVKSIKKKIKIIHAPNKKLTLVVRKVLYFWSFFEKYNLYLLRDLHSDYRYMYPYYSNKKSMWRNFGHLTN